LKAALAFKVLLKLAVAPATKIAELENVTDPERVTAPDAVKAVVCTEANVDCPSEFIEAVAVPVAGRETELNLPILAETLPVEAPVRSKIPFTESTPKTVIKPFIQFCRVRKLEFIVTLDPEIESEPKISLMFTVAIFVLYLIFEAKYIS